MIMRITFFGTDVYFSHIGISKVDFASFVLTTTMMKQCEENKIKAADAVLLNE